MSTAVLDKIRTERDQVRAAALAIAEGDNFNPEDENYRALVDEAEALDARAVSMVDLLEKQSASDALDGRLSKINQRADAHTDAETGGPRGSWGQLFTRSEGFKSYASTPHGKSRSVDVEAPQVRALPTGIADLVDAGFTPTQQFVDLTPPPVPTPLLDAVDTVTVSQNSVDYVVWEKVSGEAEVVPEKGLKPPIEWKPGTTSETLDTIAGYTQLTRQLLEDYAAVQSMIDGELRREVLLKEEAEIAATLAAATDIPAVQGDSLMSAIRYGMGTVQAAGYTASVVLLNPADWADLDFAMMNATNNGPQYQTRPWGLTPVPSPDQPEGTATVGDFKTAVKHYVRSQVQLYITDSHADTFLKNVFTLLAERRSKTAVVRAAALANASVGS